MQKQKSEWNKSVYVDLVAAHLPVFFSLSHPTAVTASDLSSSEICSFYPLFSVIRMQEIYTQATSDLSIRPTDEYSR